MKNKVQFATKETPAKCYIWSTALYGVKIGNFGNQIVNNRKAPKCRAGEGWRR
jgi:hypothetical protein